MRPSLWSSFAIVGLALGGCLLPSVDLLGAASTASQDAGADASRDATNDAAVDSRADGSQPFDCSAATFCATFDASSDVADGWSGVLASGGSSVTLDTQRSLSSPAAMLSKTLLGGPSEYRAAALYKNFALAKPKSVLARFAVRIVVAAPDGLSVGQLSAKTPTGLSAARVWFTDGAIDLSEEQYVGDNLAVDDRHVVAFPWKKDVWMRMEITVDLAARTAKLVVDGQALVTYPLKTPWSGNLGELSLGVFYSAGTVTGNQVLIDDVRVDVFP